MRLTEKELIKRLWETAEQYKPLVFKGFNKEFLLSKGIRADAVVDFAIENGPMFTALVEIVPVATPKNIALKSRVLLDYIRELNKPDLVPTIIAPYIAPGQAGVLSEKGVSWIDLSGNMMLRVPGQVYIERKGNRNRFPDTAPIKKIFQGTSSLVSRALLLRPNGFASQYEVVDFINRRNANITAGTVSRVLRSLEEDLLVRKTKSLISATDRGKLLERLVEDYISIARRRKSERYRFTVTGTQDLLVWSSLGLGSDYVFCGFYAAELKGLAKTEQISLFAKDIGQVREAFDNFSAFGNISIEPDNEFGQIVVIETKDLEPWFNAEKINNLWIVDDIELYLEMMADTPRGPRVAELLKPGILKE